MALWIVRSAVSRHTRAVEARTARQAERLVGEQLLRDLRLQSWRVDEQTQRGYRDAAPEERSAYLDRLRREFEWQDKGRGETPEQKQAAEAWVRRELAKSRPSNPEALARIAKLLKASRDSPPPATFERAR